MYKPRWYLSFLDLTLRQDSRELQDSPNLTKYSLNCYEIPHLTFSLGVNTRIKGQGEKRKIRRLPFSKPLISIHRSRSGRMGYVDFIFIPSFSINFSLKVTEKWSYLINNFEEINPIINKICLKFTSFLSGRPEVLDLLYWLQSQPLLHYISSAKKALLPWAKDWKVLQLSNRLILM